MKRRVELRQPVDVVAADDRRPHAERARGGRRTSRARPGSTADRGSSALYRMRDRRRAGDGSCAGDRLLARHVFARRFGDERALRAARCRDTLEHPNAAQAPAPLGALEMRAQRAVCAARANSCCASAVVALARVAAETGVDRAACRPVARRERALQLIGERWRSAAARGRRDCRSPSVFTSGSGRWPRASASSDT